MKESVNEDLVPLLIDVLGEFRKHNESTHQISFDCPTCSALKNELTGDGKGNLEVNYKYNTYNCWACGESHGTHGSIFKLIREYGNTNQLSQYKFIDPEFYSFTDGSESTYKFKGTLKLPSGVYPIIKNLHNDKFKDVINYLHQRGVTDDIIKLHNLHYGVDGDYFGRVVIPSYDINGKLNYFVGRTIKKWVTNKYKNPPRDEIPKTEIIFNEQKVDFTKAVSLVEGPFDHIITKNSIPMLGKVLYDKLFKLLYDKNPPMIIIILDPDAFANTNKYYYELNSGKLKNKIFFVMLPEGIDPSKMVETFGIDGYHEYIKNNLKMFNEFKHWGTLLKK